jgi:hypothetical protein
MSADSNHSDTLSKIQLWTLGIMFFMSMLFGFAHQADADITTGLVDRWTFDEGSGTSAADTGSAANTGTLTGGPTWVVGKIGTGAVSFDGINDRVTTGVDTIGTGADTFSAWVYGLDFAGSDGLPSIVENRKSIVHIEAPGKVYFTSDGAPDAVSATGLTVGQWALITVTRNASGVANIYINGVLSGSADQSSGTPSAGTTEVIIGASAFASRAWHGYIDDVRIYSRELSAGDILELYNSSDTVPPVISSIASSTTPTTATVSWHTNETATSTVRYGATTSYGSASTSAILASDTDIVITSLANSTLYHYQIVATDAFGNTATSSDLTFTTTPPDFTPPVISSVASSTSPGSVTITWTTNENSTSTVEYGLTTSYGIASSSSIASTIHSIVLTDLPTSTLYHFRVSSADPSDNYSSSTDYTFTTSAPRSHYIRANASGANDGSDWTNAWATFADVVWTRGDVYYVATGDYPGDPSGFFACYIHIEKAESGSQWIYVKKAIAADYGTSTGWSAPYGVGTANLQAKLAIQNEYIEFDGQVGSDTSGFGFAVINPTVGGQVVSFEYEKSHIHLYHTEVRGTGDAGTLPAGTTAEIGIYAIGSNPRQDIEIKYCWIHDVNRDGLAVGGFSGSPGLLYEHNRMERTGNHTDPDAHGQGFQFALSTVNSGVTIRYSTFIDISGSATISFLGGTTNSNVQIYNNQFWTTNRAVYTNSPGVIWTREGSPAVTMNGLYVFNNIFHGVGLAMVANDAITTSETYVRNNIWEDSGFSGGSYYRGAVVDHNYFFDNYNFSYADFGDTSTPAVISYDSTDILATSSPFIDAAGHDYRLNASASAINAGTSSPSVYFTDDYLGISRPQGSAWDIGAYEYLSGSDMTAPVLSSSSPTGALAAGTTGATLSVTTDEAATCKYGTVSGTAYASIASTFGTTGGTTHAQALTGLTDGTSHAYYVRCMDGSGNANLSDYTISFSVDASSGGGGGGGGGSSGGGSIIILYASSTATTVSVSSQNLLTQGADILCLTGQIFNTATGYRCTKWSGGSPLVPVGLGFYFAKNLSLGMKDSDVQKLQQYLNGNGFRVSLTGSGSAGKESMVFGPATQRALVKYQVSKGIKPAAGYFGPTTRGIVNGGAMRTSAPTVFTTPTTTNTPTPTTSGTVLRLGSMGPHVKTLRAKLRSLGYLAPYGSASDVPASAAVETSAFGATTESALRKFQCDKAIVCTGKAATTGWGATGPKTRAALEI